MDDLNYLLHREQEELLRAQDSDCADLRRTHRGVARGYADRIRDHRHPYRSPALAGRPAFDPFPFGTEEALA